MTLVVAVIDPSDGSVHIGSDSKVTWLGDEARTRKVYTEPVPKILLLRSDLAIGFSGEGPEELAAAAWGLRGRERGEVLEGLASIKGGAFVVAQYRPARLWSVSTEYGIDERTKVGRAWAGDVDAFSLFQGGFEGFHDQTVAFRFHSALQHVVHLTIPPTVGGYTIVASAIDDQGFRYQAMRSELWPESVGEATVGRVTQNSDGTVNFLLRASFSEAPLVLVAAPGYDVTPGALGLYVPNIGVGYLYLDGAPSKRVEVRASTAEEFAYRANSEYGQSIATLS